MTNNQLGHLSVDHHALQYSLTLHHSNTSSLSLGFQIVIQEISFFMKKRFFEFQVPFWLTGSVGTAAHFITLLLIKDKRVEEETKSPTCRHLVFSCFVFALRCLVGLFLFF
ncbi:hypothetical protein AMECASPLE_005767 [Ameca splendens]|uniref:Uncharacterized protein n=1 Tax=Ameca splendens TaxID=208324 RepID=A0ABV0YA76_9TELE